MTATYRQLFLSVAAIFLQFGSSANAAIIVRDFHTPGDGLLTYDTINQREWLDLTETSSLPMTTVEQLLSETGPLAGFHFATTGDVASMVQSAGYSGIGAVKEDSQSAAAAGRLIDSFGEVHRTVVKYGVFTGSPPILIITRFSTAIALNEADSSHILFGTWTKPIGSGALGSSSSYVGRIDPSVYLVAPVSGVWLYRDAAIPEPSSAGFVVFVAIAAIPFCRPRRTLKRHTRLAVPLFALTATLVAIPSASAAIIVHDFHTPGDGLLNYDTVNYREWLDLTETSILTFSEVMGQMQSGGPLSDFQFANAADVKALALSAGFPNTDVFYSQHTSLADQLIAVFGEVMYVESVFSDLTGGAYQGHAYEGWGQNESQTLVWHATYGVINGGNGSAGPQFGIASSWQSSGGLATFAGTGNYGFAGTFNSRPEIGPLPEPGVWLYRDAPTTEPQTVLLVLIGSISQIAVCRRRPR